MRSRTFLLCLLPALVSCQSEEPVVIKRSVVLESPSGLPGADGQPFTGRAVHIPQTPDGLDPARRSVVFLYPRDSGTPIGPSTWLTDASQKTARFTLSGTPPTGQATTTSPPDGGTLWYEIGGEPGAVVDLYFTQVAATCVSVKLRRRRCVEQGENGCDQINDTGFEDDCELP